MNHTQNTIKLTRNVYVSKSSIEGSGAFAVHDLRKGQIVFIAKGKLVHFQVHNRNDSKVGPNWIGIGRNLWLDPRKENPLTALNHSCDPNLGIVGHVTFVAKRGIRKGEELTFDYSTAEEDPLWRLSTRCRCGSKKCRGIIRSVKFLPANVYKSNEMFIPEYFRRAYKVYTERAK